MLIAVFITEMVILHKYVFMIIIISLYGIRYRQKSILMCETPREILQRDQLMTFSRLVSQAIICRGESSLIKQESKG